jgi:hypothetical protein
LLELLRRNTHASRVPARVRGKKKKGVRV